MDTRHLVAAAQDGDDLAVEQLHARYYPRVARIVRARLGPALRARVEVDDILQETFLHALLRLEDFEMRSESAFLDWLAAIATRQVLKAAEHWGREKRDPGRELALDGQHPDDAITGRVAELTARITGPVTRAVRNERDRILEEALDELEDDQREVLLLRDFVGLSHAEVAERLGRPSEAAGREFYRRARARLGIVLRRRGFRPEGASEG